MKKLLPIVFVGLLMSLFVLPQAPASATQDPGADVGGLAIEVAELRQEVTRQEALLNKTVAYIQAQSRAAAKLDTVYNSSEDMGFTAGINFESREVLLAGLRAYTASQRKGVPGVPKKKAPADGKPSTPPGYGE